MFGVLTWFPESVIKQFAGGNWAAWQSTNKRTKKMNGDTIIYVSGRKYKVPGHLVTYEQIVKIWNELHAAENKHIIGTPGLDYEDDLKGKSAVLQPGKSVAVKDGTSFTVDPEHVS